MYSYEYKVIGRWVFVTNTSGNINSIKNREIFDVLMYSLSIAFCLYYTKRKKHSQVTLFSCSTMCSYVKWWWMNKENEWKFSNGWKNSISVIFTLSCNFPLRDNDLNKYFIWWYIPKHLNEGANMCLLDTITCWYNNRNHFCEKVFYNRNEIIEIQIIYFGVCIYFFRCVSKRKIADLWVGN